MKTSTMISLFALLLATQASAGRDPGPVDRVTVYADRAEITRAANADCKSASVEVTFPLLPTSLDERTLRAEASGKAKAIGLTSRIIPLEENRDARVAEVRRELIQVQDKIRELSETLAGSRERVAVLDAFGVYFMQLLNEQVRNARPDPRRWTKVLDAMEQEHNTAAARQGELNIRLRDLGRKQERLQRRLQALQPRNETEARSVSVAIECHGETRPRVTLSYVVPGATWHPEYDLRFVPQGKAKVGRGRAELTVSAVVQQSTGEDWKDAKLLLSTSKPRLGSEAPYPAPIYVNGHKVGEQKTLVATMERREKLTGKGEAQGQGPAGAALEDKGQSFALTIPRRVSVMADGRPYWMPVDVASARAEAKLVTVPKLRPFVYQVVQLKNPAAYPLLAGRVHIYRGGSYVGDTDIEYKAPGEPMEISMGIDEELKVERRELSTENRSASFLSSTKHLERSFRIRVINRARSRQAVEVRENIPVSKTEQVKVELVKDKTAKHYQFDRHRGFISWTLRLSPAREKSVDLAYTIHLPEDWKVNVR
ncbi:MAG TPA: mucoidy inhibitor MuiA family protein [Myxococcota bacterium]|nr:mucoidy inhibitor MuiA family protein [Myxococcota bacterium]